MVPRILAVLALLSATGASAPSRVLFTVPATHRLIEGIATDGRKIWLSSVVDRQILAWHGGRLQTIPMPPGIARPLGLAYDAKRDWLWIATDCVEIAAGPCTEDSALIAIDRNGLLKVRLAPEDGPAHFGDVSVAGGIVTVGDSANGAVYRCREACTALETVVPRGIDRSAQGSAAYGDSRVMIADYGTGIVSVDKLGNRTILLREDGRPLRGVDGFARAGNRFIGVQNSQSPGVVFAFRLTADGRHIADITELASGKDFPEPTQIAVHGRQVYIVADAQWSAYDTRTVTRPAQHATPIRVLVLPDQRSASRSEAITQP